MSRIPQKTSRQTPAPQSPTASRISRPVASSIPKATSTNTLRTQTSSAALRTTTNDATKTSKPTLSRPKSVVSVKPPPSPSSPRVAGHGPTVRKVASRPGLKRDDAPSISQAANIEPPSPKPTMNIRAAIAAKRAETAKSRKMMQSNGGSSSFADDGLAADIGSMSLGNQARVQDENAEMGRWSVIETIERARSTGTLNLSSRSLPCIPSSLYEIHLGIRPEPLASVAEPDFQGNDTQSGNKNRAQPAWFEAQDLEVLKAGNNEIIELQPELNLFGSLKVIDLHKNQLETIPAALGALSSLTTLNLSFNRLKAVPVSIYALPSLTILNLSHNQLTVLPFSKFNSADAQLPSGNDILNHERERSRATAPLPNLLNLDVSHNKLTSDSITASHLPSNLVNVNLSHNPFDLSSSLISAFSELPGLIKLQLECSSVSDEVFTSSITARPKFPRLRLLDLGETKATENAVRNYFANSPRSKEITFDVTTAEPRDGELRIVVGKRIIKEPWEIEAERRAMKKRGVTTDPSPTHENDVFSDRQKEIAKEQWEIDAEQGLLTEGGRRRARAAAAAASVSLKAEAVGPSVPSERKLDRSSTSSPFLKTTEESVAPLRSGLQTPTPSTSSLANPIYYNSSTQTLTLPTSAPPTRATHGRAFSLAASPSKTLNSRNDEDLTVPTPTLPLDVLSRQTFASTLRILNLSGRRAKPVIGVPEFFNVTLPCLEELDLEGCMLGDNVPVSRETSSNAGVSTSTSVGPELTKEPTLEFIAKLFPSLVALNLSYNNLTSSSLSASALSLILIPSPNRKGLQILRLRGNRINELNGFLDIAEIFKGNRQVDGWRMEQLDLQDNEIGRLAPEMGLLPLDVFLVDGNTFRIPPRKIWEREGTKGLLSWLRGRLE